MTAGGSTLGLCRKHHKSACKSLADFLVCDNIVNLTCACGSSRYGMEIRRSAVDLVCRDCGAKLRIPAATDRDLDDLCCHMKLVIPGGERN